ncbi:major facilitator superfamily domain-containing protein [Dactylonectria estremocensis]|uniref:Major facilitator superfamily domain-containing protein n=1 Tax=Dactylonectria estremocensis TaxID=1079267 RepID=A0A9P9D5A5_9HYPO|nr:major facilitator superfamily domain-containing protein [Dactylonectria estremocensis]
MAISEQNRKALRGSEVKMVEDARNGGDVRSTEDKSDFQMNHVQYTDKEKSAVRRKIDWRIMPLAAWSCGLQFVDKSALGAAATYGLRDDLNLHGQEYSWCVSIFYFGYLVGSFVSGRGLQYFHCGRFIGAAYFFWGGTLLGCMGANGFASLMVLRFLLGIAESCLVPGLLLITTMWYTQKEQPLRFGLWTALNGFLPVPFLMIYYGLGHVTASPLVSWKLIFLLLGILSCITGILLWLIMPDSPETATWLTEKERAIAVARMAEDQLGVKNDTFKWDQLKEALLDYRCWMIVLQMFFSQAMGNVTTNFLGIIIKGFGYSQLKAQLFTAPNYACQGFTQLIVSGLPTYSRRFRNMKQPLTAVASIISLIGVIILHITPPEPEYQNRRLGACILLSCAGVNYTVIMSVIGSNITGFTKKQLVTSMSFFLYCVINIITPQTFIGTESPRYPTGMVFVMTLISIFIAVTLSTWMAMRLENARRDKKAKTDPSYTPLRGEECANNISDDTDKQNKRFRYSP